MSETLFTTSKDGTRIAISKVGHGKSIIIVDGAMCHRNFGANVKLPQYLVDHFTVYSYDRRGRGESGNTLPYAIEREFEDLQAVQNVVGESAYVYGISSGAALVLEAANAGISMRKIALFEAPYIVDNSRPPLSANYLETLSQHANNGEEGKTIKYFLKTGIGLPSFVVWMMQLMPAWRQMKKISHTIVYDTMLIKDYSLGKPFEKETWANVKIPALIMSGTKSPKWSQNSMKQLADSLPNATHLDLKGQSHIVSPKVIAQKLIDFFNG